MPFSLLVCFKVSTILFPAWLIYSIPLFFHMPRTRNWFWFSRHEQRRIAYVRGEIEMRARRWKLKLDGKCRRGCAQKGAKFIHNSWWVSADLSWLTASVLKLSLVFDVSFSPVSKAVNLLSWEKKSVPLWMWIEINLESNFSFKMDAKSDFPYLALWHRSKCNLSFVSDDQETFHFTLLTTTALRCL